MLNLPDRVLAVIKAVEAQNRDDVQKAVSACLTELTKQNLLTPKVRSILIERGLRHTITDFRHSANTEIKNRPWVGKVQKPRVTSGKAMRDMLVNSWMRYAIQGRALGEFLGAELIPAATREEDEANGKLRIAKLIRRIAGQMPKDKMVKEVMTDQQIDGMWKKIK